MSIETRLRETGPRGGGGGSSSGSTAGLATTGATFLLSSLTAEFPNALYIKPGSSATTHITGSNLFINAITNTFAGSAGLAGTGVYYLGTSANSTWPNWLVLQPGSSTTTHITGSNLYVNANTANVPVNSGGLAGTGHTYIFSSLVAGYPNSLYIKPGSSVTTHITGSNLFINATTSASSSSGGLAGTGLYYLVGSNETTLPSSKVIKAGSSVTTHTDSTSFYINATTSIGSSSGGLAGTGWYYLTGSSASGLPFSKVLTAGSSITTHTDSTNFYINATTSAGGSSGGLAGTGGLLLAYSSQAVLWPFSKILAAGSSVTTHTDSTSFYINATTSAGGSSGGLAGTGMFYIMSTAQTGFPNSRQMLAGSSTIVRTDGTNIYIDALTPTLSPTSGGLAGTGMFYLMSTAQTSFPNSRQVLAGSSVVVRTDATNFYIDAITSLAAGSPANPAPIQLLPQQAKLYASNSAARIDAGTALWRLIYSPTTQQYGIWQFRVPNDYSSSPSIRILWGGLSGISVAQSITWTVQQWGWSPLVGNSSIYIDSFGAANSVSVALSAGYSSGTLQSMTIPLASVVSLGAGNLNRIRITSTGAYVGNSELYGTTFDYQGSAIASTSAGLAGTGGLLLAYSSQVSTYPLSKILVAGSSVTTHTDSTSFYINATTSAGGSSGGLAGTGGFYVSYAADATLSVEKVLTAGTGITLDTSSTAINVHAISKDYNYWYNVRTNHLLGAFGSVGGVWYVAGQISATALSTAVPPINSANCFPFVTTKHLKVDSLGVNVTIAGSVTTVQQLAIYTNSADECLFPFQCVASSGVVNNSNLGIFAFNPGVVLTANNLYWFAYMIGRSAMTVRGVPVAAAFPILGNNSGLGTAPGLGYQIFLNALTSFPATMPGSGNVVVVPYAAIGARGSI